MTTLRLLLSKSSINVGEYVLGLICAIAICVAAYLLLMVAYFMVRRKKPSAKYSIELIFALIAMALSVGVKLAILPFLAEDANGNVQNFSFVEYMGYSLSAIYSMIGGLQFEGLPFGMESISGGIVVCLYYGSSIIAGLIVLSVITAKASYEIFSLVIINVLKRRRDVYIFNCLTPDALLLAESIAAHHQQELVEYKNNKNKSPNLKKPRKALILFAGNNIPTFSRNDPNCREVMSQSFYYYSLMKGKDTTKSLFSRLNLGRKNLSLLASQPTNILNKEAIDCELKNVEISNTTTKKLLGNKGNRTRIMEFYFTLDEYKKPMQEKNTFDAFSEVDMIIDDLFYKRNTIRLKNSYTSWLKKSTASKGELKRKEIEEKIYLLLYNIGLKASWTITEQYILTQSEVNYQYYSTQIDERVNKIVEHLLSRPASAYFGARTAKNLFASFGLSENNLNENFTLNDLIKANKQNYDDLFKIGFDKEFKNILAMYVYSILQVNLVNEAYLSSLSLIDERYKKLGASSIWEHLASVDEWQGNSEYKALILGFGGNGQNALHALYYASPHLEDDGSSTGFYADVFDTNIEEIEGMFAKNHPLYHCYPISSSDVDVNEEEIKNYYKEFLKNDGKGNYSYEEFCSKMQFPKIVFHRDSCSSVSFIKFFDEKTGKEFTANGESFKKNKEYNIIVIALGNDSTNIAIANTIIDDIKRELYLEINSGERIHNRRRQCIAVNIRDKNNLRKLNWNETDFKYGLFKNVVVFPFGSKEDIYTFDKIIDHSAMYEYNTNYINMTHKIDELQIKKSNNSTLEARFNLAMTTLSDKFCVERDVNGELRLDKLFSKIYEERNKADKLEIDSIKYNLSYFKLTNFKKETNRISNVYSRIMRRAVKHFCRNEKGEYSLNLDCVRKLVVLEHERWNRFMISHGWIYSKVKGEEHKMHNAILPLANISEYSFAYDLVNVIPQIYKIYNHCHILYKDLIKHSNTVEEIYADLVNFLSYCYNANGLTSTRYLIEIVNNGKYPTIAIRFEPTSTIGENIESGKKKEKNAVLFSMHYDLHSHYDKNGNKCDLSDNSIYVDDYSTPCRAFSVYGGADDLAGVACVIYGIVSALKEQEGKPKQKNIVVLISGGEERGSKGISEFLTPQRKDELAKTVKECLVVDINDRIGVYSTKGTRLECVNLFAPMKAKEFLENMNISFSETSDNSFILKLYGKNEDEITRKIQDIIKTLNEKELNATINSRKILAHEFSTENSDFITRLKSAIEKAGATSKRVEIEKSLSDANVIANELNVPTILLSSGAINAHNKGEYVYLDDIEKNVEIIKNYVVD